MYATVNVIPMHRQPQPQGDEEMISIHTLSGTVVQLEFQSPVAGPVKNRQPDATATGCVWTTVAGCVHCVRARLRLHYSQVN